MTEAGFTAGSYFETKLKGVVDREIFPEAGGASEDYGRAPVWTAFGATK
jgi:hypothetical protein